MCRIIVSATRVYRIGVLCGFIRFALLLAVVLCLVDRCFDSWVLLGLLCLLRRTRAPVGSVLPARTVAQHFGHDLLVTVLHLLPVPSC